MMLILDIALIDALKARGIELAEPISCDDWTRLSFGLSPTFAANLKIIYSHFNGFLTEDHKSQMRLWSVSEVISKNSEIGFAQSASSFYIGDFLIESDYIRFDPDLCLVKLEADEESCFEGIKGFIHHLAMGGFDFL